MGKLIIIVFSILWSTASLADSHIYIFNSQKSYNFFLAHLWYTEEQFKGRFKVQIDRKESGKVYVLADSSYIATHSWIVHHTLKENADEIIKVNQ